jgi:hypothetical protein
MILLPDAPLTLLMATSMPTLAGNVEPLSLIARFSIVFPTTTSAMTADAGACAAGGAAGAGMAPMSMTTPVRASDLPMRMR